MKRTMFIAFVATLICGDVSATEALTRCQTTLIAHGLIFRGSVVCNQDWLERAGSLALLERARSCNKTPKAERYLKRGYKDFDIKSSEIGMAESCKNIDKAISALDQ